ncbi:hypothetical protein ACIRD8_28245 [Streptomyces sp. NPDC102451]|uniref:hypothetical protein n=1 Tax=Streptomyces sp. NPDC102451 TaxID=3366177 RepID=UPI003829422F
MAPSLPSWERAPPPRRPGAGRPDYRERLEKRRASFSAVLTGDTTAGQMRYASANATLRAAAALTAVLLLCAALVLRLGDYRYPAVNGFGETAADVDAVTTSSPPS